MQRYVSRTWACALAGLLTALAVCAGDAAARTFPFGPRTRAVNDLGNQFVPFHAHLWDLLHGRADGGLLLNWRSGYGTSFLPDLGTYLTSPFSVLVGLFPRDDIDLAVYVITVAKMAAAAAAMTGLLLALRTGSRWGAAVLGASYALCGWSVVEASYNPMWLDGLIAFPLLCLVGAWVRDGRRPVLGPVVVAVAWVANFYTAYMATIGAALVLMVVLLIRGVPGWRVLGRAARTVLLGVGLAAPVLVPVFLGSRHAYPGWTREFAPAGWADVAARALPATYGFFTPAVFLGTGALLLAAALPFHRRVPARERWVWTGLVVAVLLSAQWEPTHLVWHVFATPNGSPYRQTFVLAGVVVLTAWTAVSYGWPGWRALGGGVAVLGVVAAGAAPSDLVTAWAYGLFAAGLAAAVGAVLLIRRPGYAVVGAALLSGALVGQAAATTAHADRERPARLDDYPAWGAPHEARAAAVAGSDGWPRHRTDPGRPQLTGNDPLLVGGQGAAYYSSHTPAVLTRTLAALGGGWTSNGRSVQSLDNPVTDALFAVGARVRGADLVRGQEVLRGQDVLRREEVLGRDGVLPGQGVPRGPEVLRGPGVLPREHVLPLVTLRPPGRELRYGASPFRNQELLLGSRVYDLPADGACPVGSDVHLWAPDFSGTARLGAGAPVRLSGGLPKRRAAMVPLGTQRTAGVRVTLDGRGAVPPGSVGCLDRARLAKAVARLKATGAVAVHVTADGVRADLPPGPRGTAVLAAPRIAGWRCEGRPAGSYGGLVAVDVAARTAPSSVECAFRPPGLRAGTGVGAAALAALVLWRAGSRGPGRLVARAPGRLMTRAPGRLVARAPGRGAGRLRDTKTSSAQHPSVARPPAGGA
ncbi:YfhO family protein [Streptomyces ficellus]|uniref:YfhO family protein n=1 Tax=Streptomyces ficellus TaxID=1977088 RepID=A0ABT7Z0V7_9ACTN|nr:YfhO family protein [Streptomyces ficellus]MDN3293121.1 YfhO family protein [Streptomyces ficellus]